MDQIGMNALAAEVYPTAIRSTGVGWALGVGRIGSIIGPLVGGGLLALGWPTSLIITGLNLRTIDWSAPSGD